MVVLLLLSRTASRNAYRHVAAWSCIAFPRHAERSRSRSAQESGSGMLSSSLGCALISEGV